MAVLSKENCQQTATCKFCSLGANSLLQVPSNLVTTKNLVYLQNYFSYIICLIAINVRMCTFPGPVDKWFNIPTAIRIIVQRAKKSVFKNHIFLFVLSFLFLEHIS